MAQVSRKRRATRGSTILELSFIFLVFFALLMGIFDFGQFLYIHQALVERARWAARAGLVTTASTDQIKNLVLYGQATSGTNPYFGLTTSMVTVTASDAGTWNSRISVVISNYPYKMFSPYISGNY